MEGLQDLEPATVRRFERDWEGLFNRGDHAGLAACYADDAQVIASGHSTFQGRIAIEQFWEQACRGARAAGVVRTVHVEAVDRSTDLSALRGRVVVRHDANVTTFRFVTLWRRDVQGRWRIEVDISSPTPGEP